MVLRKVYDTVNKVGGAWLNINQGIYNGPTKAARGTDEARVLLTEVVADWPEGVPETRAVHAARQYLRQAGE